MKIRDGSIEVLVANYSGNPTQPNLVAVGYKFKGSIYTINDFVSVVAALNQTCGWHFRDRLVSIGGVQYNIAEVYEEELPLRKIYRMEEIAPTSEVFAKLNQFCLPVAYLNIPPALTLYVPQPEPQPIQQTPPNPKETVSEKGLENMNEAIQIINNPDVEDSNSVSHSDIQRYKEYISEKELDAFGDLNNLSDEELEALEGLYEYRKGEALQKSLVSYELPNELNNYNLIYREAVLGKSIMASNGETEDDIKKMKHELGLREVVEAMFSEIPSTEKSDDDSDDVMNSYRYLGNQLDNCFEKGIDRVLHTPVTVEVDAHRFFLSLDSALMTDLKKTYGTFNDFVDKYLAMKVGEEVLAGGSISHKGVSFDFKIVKTYDNNKGYGIGFITETEKGPYLFPYALFALTAFLDEQGRVYRGKTFASAYNELLESFCKEIGATGLNLENMKISTHEVEVINANFLGSCIDEGILMYLFQRLSDGKFFVIYKESLGNKMFGAKYLVMGENFMINYLGRSVIVAPTMQPMYTTKEAVNNFIEENISSIVEVFPGYYTLMDCRVDDDIENNAIKRIIQSYDEMIKKTWAAGYSWNTDLATVPDITTQIPTQSKPADEVKVIDPFATQNENLFDAIPDSAKAAVVKSEELVAPTTGAVDIFGSQPSEIFGKQEIETDISPDPFAKDGQVVATDKPRNVEIVSAVTRGHSENEEVFETNPIMKCANELSKVYEKLDHKDQSRMIAMLNNIMEIYTLE